MTNKIELGELLAKHRIKHGYKQKQIAKILDIDRSSVTSYETGRNMPNIFTLIQLSELYNISILNLISTRE